MKSLHLSPRERGQAHVEYVLLVLFVAVVVLAVLFVFGPQISNLYQQATGSLPGQSDESELSPIGILLQDFLARIQAYYDKYGHWPRSWGDYKFTDLGLDPDDWEGPVDGIYWNPNGQYIGLGNKKGDNLQVYVTDMDGNQLHLYDGWNIWCSSGGCYYHTVSPDNLVDINSVVVVTVEKEKPKKDKKDDD
jgi:Flp pilus assembly pilin Flp